VLKIAAELGADVPFFLFEEPRLGVSKGDEIYPLPDLERRTLLIVAPKEDQVPTPDAYRWLACAGPAVSKSGATINCLVHGSVLERPGREPLERF